MAERHPAPVTAGLTRWAAVRFGSATRIEGVRDLGGHSGDTFGFALIEGKSRRGLVVRIAPAGVKRNPSTDVLRQAPLLRAMKSAGVAVAEVIDAFEEPAIFDAPCLIVAMLPGRPLIMGPDAAPSGLTRSQREDAYRAAARELAKIHAVKADALAAWEGVRTPADEIRSWQGAWERSPEPEWAEAAGRLSQDLFDKMPQDWTDGACHGDFQSNNVLFEAVEDRIRIGGVVDWEVAHVGATEHDVAWFLMMNDPEAWDPVERRGNVDLDAVVAAYELEAGRRLGNLAWFRALACYRIAAIAAFNIRLHRSGRRPDPAWERASRSMPCFFARAQTHLQAV